MLMAYQCNQEANQAGESVIEAKAGWRESV
jgi:hypothetical protein